MIGRPGIAITGQIHDYLLRTSFRDSDVQRRLREETAATIADAGMQIGPEQGQFMGFLAMAIGARKCIEVGVFTGYSSLSVAMALPRNGKIIACDISVEYTNVARKYWEEAGVAHMIDLRLGPALKTLEGLLHGSHDYDFAFIDADKVNYDGYYERCLKLVRKGGIIAIDNVLWGGAVADSSQNDPDTVALRELNAKIGRDQRVDLSMLPVGDGLTLVRKR
ncbi:MAG: class I SAM-dependent methyltransferase [Vulcanimicrobiaceae bacterium]